MKYHFDRIDLAIDLVEIMVKNGHSVAIKQKYSTHAYGEELEGYEVEVSDEKDRINIKEK